jgi:hypothetical protein
MAKGSKYNTFRLDSWRIADSKIDDFKNNKNGAGGQNLDDSATSIEEAFDLNHENLMNYSNNNNHFVTD